MTTSTVSERPPIAHNLRALKERSGLTWAAIARALEVNERWVYEWARPDGAYQPSWPNVVKLAALFELDDPGWFYCAHEAH